LQIDALKAAGVDERNIFTDKVSGTTKERPQFQKLLEILRAGDTLVVYGLDRAGRSLRHLVELMEELRVRGIEFVSLRENIDTTSATGKLIFGIFAALAEFERDLIVERIRAGLTAARARGRKGGRPKKDKKKIELALKMYSQKTYTIKEIATATGVSKTTLYRYLKN
jgi:DNA invertase Pin-like site-specific DNA recombinase